MALDPHTTTPWAVAGSRISNETRVHGRFEVEDWCEPTPWLSAVACETFLNYPIWSTVLLVDIIGVWLIIAIMLRQREQDGELKRAKLSLPSTVRARRAWQVVGFAVRLATFGAGSRKEPYSQRRHCDRGAWQKSWQEVIKARAIRKEYLYKKDFNLGATVTRAVGPLLMCLVLMIVFFLTHALYTVGIPWLGLPSLLDQVLRFVMFLVPARILQDYFRTAFTDPGLPSSLSPGAVDMNSDMELGVFYGKELHRCEYCKGAKPARAHHCKVCRRCVLKMDHHCPFINNCIGLRNHRYFCLFLLDVSVGTFLVAAIFLPQVVDLVWLQRFPATFARRVHVVAAFGLCMFLQSGMIPFLLFHIQLILWNQTTLEFIGGRRGHGRHEEPASHSRGAMENFIEVCGAPPIFCERHVRRLLDWLVPQHVAKLAKRSA